MKKLFLTSYFAGTVDQFKQFIKTNQISAKEVTFITTAGNVEDYTGYIDEGRQALQDLGFQVNDLDIASTATASVTQAIAAAEILFITGGNTFYLLQELKRQDLLGLISARIKAGIPYVGESAGAIVLAPTITYNKMMDDATVAPALTDDRGFALTDFYPLPHQGEEPFKEAVEEIIATYQDQLKLLPINNSQAIMVNGDSYQII
ncbi:Type 1 glutamine amidotransferase-like domain-containing protein [Lactobacillus xylocopicola]|uniref:Peptidase S51 n=1 Tax=Lactobacillus xylocopicola TaxID=2976676 RepID=A0ABM8BEW6_9LACO|nr:Type 1 glutamine amidotransferase-like domain-containing protein [Lactobacillus xylocopicola]BDR59775.1 peptidase S51 [Lactobacillus xylocopicola]